MPRILLLSFLFFTSSVVFADDTSCELKTDKHKSLQPETGNEFTQNKTWRFKLDNILHEDENQLNGKKKKTQIEKTTTQAVKI